MSFNPSQVILEQYLKLIGKRRNSKNFRTSLTPRKADYDVNKHIVAKNANDQTPRQDGQIYFCVGMAIKKKSESRCKRRAVRN